MANIYNMTGQCGKPFAPGTNARLYWSYKGEHSAGFPAVTGTAAQGDSVTLVAAFDFTGAATGEGYWKSVDILVDTGGVKETVEGEVGGQGVSSGVRFFVPGTGPAQTEFHVCQAAYSGCWIGLIKEKGATLSTVIGTVDVPAVLESMESDSGEKLGDRRGAAYAMKSSTNLHYYDDATHGIDVTPNP